MKLLFFSTAALMTVAFASKAAHSVTTSASTWFEDPMLPCDPPSQFQDSNVHVFNFYDSCGCQAQPEECACSAPSVPSCVVSSSPVESSVHEQKLIPVEEKINNIKRIDESLTRTIKNSRTVTLTPVIETVTYHETVVPSWTSTPVVETLSTQITVTPSATFHTTTVDGVTVTSVDTTTPDIIIETETYTTTVHDHVETFTTTISETLSPFTETFTETWSRSISGQDETYTETVNTTVTPLAETVTYTTLVTPSWASTP